MNNCFDYSGNETACNDPFCIGSQCENAPDMEDATFDDIGLGGTEGLWDMDGEQFQEWFSNLYDWGEQYAMFNEDGGDVPWWISEEDAMQFTNIFHQYNNYNEILAQTQFNRDKADADRMYDTWSENTWNAMIEEEFFADQGVDIRNRQNALMSDYQQSLNSLENKSNKLKLQEEKKKYESIKASKGQHTEDVEADKLYREEILDAFNQYTNTEDDRKRKVTRQMNEILRAKDASKALKRIKTHRIAEDKLLNKDLTVQSLWRSTKNKIMDMREDYEVNLYNQMAQLASSGAFFEYAEPDAGYFGAAVEEWEGCRITCDDGCEMDIACGDVNAAGEYWGAGNCCPDENGDQVYEPACDEFGCAAWGLTGCVEEC